MTPITVVTSRLRATVSSMTYVRTLACWRGLGVRPDCKDRLREKRRMSTQPNPLTLSNVA